MRFAVAVAGFAATALAAQAPQGYATPPEHAKNETSPQAPSYTTTVVTAFTTYCPEATSIEHGGQTFTVTAATTLTLPCPTGCAVSVPVYSSVVTSCSTCSSTPAAAPTYPASTPVSPYYPSKNATVPASTPPAGTGAYQRPAGTSPVSPPAYTGAANKATFGVAGVLAAVGAIAAL